jgi:hypothetical protein
MYELFPRPPTGSRPSVSSSGASFELEPGESPRTPSAFMASKPLPSIMTAESVILSQADSTHTSKFAPKFAARPSNHNFFKHHWLWEVSGAIFSLLCTMVVILILSKANGKPLSSWRFPVSPNALISIFSTLAKAALMVPVAACISQLKWMYFENAHALNELDVFDEASRGPWGSLELIFRLKMKPRAIMATWGSVITILALAMDPFAQQILSFPSHRTLLASYNGTSAYLAATQLYDNRVPIVSGTAEEVLAKNCEYKSSVSLA